MRPFALALLAALATALPAHAQSVGYATGLPGRDPAGGDGFGWGPAYRPETSFAQPGTPPTPGRIAGEAYRAHTGRGVYDGVQGPLTTGAFAPDAAAYGRASRRSNLRTTRAAKSSRHGLHRAMR